MANQNLAGHQKPSQAQDSVFMARAIQLAKKGQYTVSGNPLVGCVLVNDNQIIAEGWHKKAGSAHAEVDALEQLKQHDQSRLAKGATAYVTLEPCCHQGKTGPCAQALIEAGIARVICAMQDPAPHVSGGGIAALKQAGLEVVCGVLATDAAALNPGFIKRMSKQLPYVRLKLAMSLDGKTALNNGKSQWITSAHARHDVHRWRAQSHAVITGASSVLNDDPQMTARLEPSEGAEEGEREEEGEVLEHKADSALKENIEQPLRVVIDSQGRVASSAKVFGHDNRCRIAGLNEHADYTIPANAQQKVNLRLLLERLAEEEVNEVWIEAGAQLSGAFLEEHYRYCEEKKGHEDGQSLVDEIIIYMAPIILGDKAKSLFVLPELKDMQDKKRVKLINTRQVGQDMRMIFSTHV